MSAFVKLEDKNNELLKRREIRCTFKGISGKLTRKEAIATLSRELKLDSKFVIPIKLSGETGSTDILGTFYVYDDENSAKSHLPKYFFLRMLTKEERKKLKEEAAKAKKAAERPSTQKKAPKEETKAEAKPKEEKTEVPKKEAKAEKMEEGPK